jgi:hypothetical protein
MDLVATLFVETGELLDHIVAASVPDRRNGMFLGECNAVTLQS